MRRIFQIACLALACASAGAAESPAEAPWPRVQIKNEQVAGAVRRALDGAALRLAGDRCQQVFSDFKDGERRPLVERLATLDQTGRGYLDYVVFLDGSQTKQCENPSTIAYTAQGYRTVFVCGRRFAQVGTRDPNHAEAIMIHETLHTLGLGENPPASVEITARVMRSCPR